MKTTLNQTTLNTVAKVLANQIKALEAQGYTNLYSRRSLPAAAKSRMALSVAM